MNKSARMVCLAALAAAFLGALTGCGGSGSAAPAPPSGNGPPETIQGIATPTSVSVVTATNAN